MAFDFPYGYFWGVAFLGRDRRIAYDAFDTVVTKYPPGAQDASLIGSHDVTRAWSKAAGAAWRQRRAVEISMFTKATPFVYYGDELGLHDGTAFVVDPRDSARAPMPWTRAEGHGFSTGKPWLAIAEGAEETNVEAEDADPTSMLTFYRELLAFRRGHPVWGAGEMHLVPLDNTAILAFVRRDGDDALLVAENLSEDPQEGVAPATDVTAPGDVVWGDGEASIDSGNVRVKLAGTGSAVFKLAR